MNCFCIWNLTEVYLWLLPLKFNFIDDVNITLQYMLLEFQPKIKAFVFIVLYIQLNSCLYILIGSEILILTRIKYDDNISLKYGCCFHISFYTQRKHYKRKRIFTCLGLWIIRRLGTKRAFNMFDVYNYIHKFSDVHTRYLFYL